MSIFILVRRQNIAAPTAVLGGCTEGYSGGSQNGIEYLFSGEKKEAIIEPTSEFE